MTDIADRIADIEGLLTRKLNWRRREIAGKMSAALGFHAIDWRRWRNGDFKPNVDNYLKIEAFAAKVETGEINGVDRGRKRRAKATRGKRTVVKANR